MYHNDHTYNQVKQWQKQKAGMNGNDSLLAKVVSAESPVQEHLFFSLAHANVNCYLLTIVA